MDGSRLSPRERRILAEIEHDLAEDGSLARALGSGRPPPGPRRLRIPTGPARAAVALGSVAITLFVVAVATGSPSLVWAFAAVWVLTLVCVLRLLLRWSRRHLTGDERPRPDQEDVS